MIENGDIFKRILGPKSSRSCCNAVTGKVPKISSAENAVNNFKVLNETSSIINWTNENDFTLMFQMLLRNNETLIDVPISSNDFLMQQSIDQ